VAIARFLPSIPSLGDSHAFASFADFDFGGGLKLGKEKPNKQQGRRGVGGVVKKKGGQKKRDRSHSLREQGKEVERRYAVCFSL
jgi:hypothetical protein